MEINNIAVGIVPFTTSCVPLISNLGLINPIWKLAAAVSPSGIGVLGKDLCLLQNTAPCGIVGTDQLSSLDPCSVIVISPGNENSPDLYQMSLDAIAYSLEAGKEVWCLQKLSAQEQSEFARQAKSNGAVFHYLKPEKLPVADGSDTNAKLFVPKVPVIGIGELVDDVDGFDVLLGTVQECRRRGLRVSVICRQRLGILFGFHAAKLFPSKIAPEEHIRRLNKLLQQIDEEEKPDLIFVLFPRPMIPYDAKIVFDFGVSAFLLAQAIKPDYFICCSTLGTLSPDFWQAMSQNFAAKFGFNIDAVHFSNRFYDDSEEVRFSNHLPRICFPPAFAADAAMQAKFWPGQMIFDFKSQQGLAAWYEYISTTLLHAPYYVLD